MSKLLKVDWRKAIVCLLLCFVLPATVSSQDYSQPLEEHEVLKQTVGVWDAEIAILNPGGEPTRYNGVETIKMLGKFWTTIDYEFEFMGQMAKSHGTIGFDPVSKRFVGTWHESTSPFIGSLEGTYDSATSTTTYTMKTKNMNGKQTEYKVVFVQPDADHRTFELFTKPSGSGDMVKIVSTKYTKRK